MAGCETRELREPQTVSQPGGQQEEDENRLPAFEDRSTRRKFWKLSREQSFALVANSILQIPIWGEPFLFNLRITMLNSPRVCSELRRLSRILLQQPTLARKSICNRHHRYDFQWRRLYLNAVSVCSINSTIGALSSNSGGAWCRTDLSELSLIFVQ